MNENTEGNQEYASAQPGYTPSQYEYPSGEENSIDNPVILRRKIKKSYGWTGTAMILQFAFVLVVSIVASMIVSTLKLQDYMAANPGAGQQEVMQASMDISTEMSNDSVYLITVNAIGYLVGNLSAFFIAIAAVKGFKTKDIFGRPQLGAGQVALGVLGTLGLQGLSVFVQSLAISITGITGVDEGTAGMMGFSDNSLSNIIMLVYFVIIAPITEEMLCRGFVLNALSPVDRTFALFASAILFGLMHGNFNQMFNGFLLGLLLGYIALKSGSIISSIICHMAANANAMFCSYFYEYKMLNEAGEEAAGTAEMIHFAVLLVIGIIATILLLKKNGKIKPEDRIVSNYDYSERTAGEKGLKWKLWLTRPTFWIVAVFYIFNAVLTLTPVE